MKQSWTARYGGKCLLDSWADMTSPRFGGPWTERKLQILQAYLDSYTTALKNQPFALTYVDGFAGAGSYRESGADYDEFDEFRQGSTRIALAIDDKPFDRFVFIEKEVGAAEALLTLASEFQGRQIEVVQGDANIGVPQFCHNMSDFDRAVVFLDPYATEVSWDTWRRYAGAAVGSTTGSSGAIRAGRGGVAAGATCGPTGEAWERPPTGNRRARRGPGGMNRPALLFVAKTLWKGERQ